MRKEDHLATINLFLSIAASSLSLLTILDDGRVGRLEDTVESFVSRRKFPPFPPLVVAPPHPLPPHPLSPPISPPPPSPPCDTWHEVVTSMSLFSECAYYYVPGMRDSFSCASRCIDDASCKVFSYGGGHRSDSTACRLFSCACFADVQCAPTNRSVDAYSRGPLEAIVNSSPNGSAVWFSLNRC